MLIVWVANYIVVQNTSISNENDQNMTGSSIDMNRNKLIYEFPDNFILKSLCITVRILARNTSKKSLATTPRDGVISLIADRIITWKFFFRCFSIKDEK